MTDKDIIKAAIAAEGTTQAALAKALGKSSQQAVGNMLSRENGMRVDNFVKMLSAMGYDVIVRKSSVCKENEWRVEM